ncbi:MAG: M48 family metallopeptidase [Pirellulales bacterium]
MLFEFVEMVCRTVGSPRPRRIDVDLDVNASASFRRGIWSMLGNDLVLTIGMPLAAGMTTRQFGGILAHEFGHFTQGLGMRLSYVIRAISIWFARVAYERDSWDEWLEAHSRDGDGWIVLLANLGRGGVWLGRLVLRGLTYVGHAVAGVMLRQMEYDADLHEIRFGGSPSFAATSRRLTLLNVASNGAYSDLNDFYRDGRLVDDMPKLVMANVETMPEEVRKQIAKVTAEARTGWYDTHPCDNDRIAFAEKQNAPGVFADDGPASDLFANFSTLCKSATWNLYKQVFNGKVKSEEVHSADTLLAGQKTEQAYADALDRYFAGGFRVTKPMELPWQVPDPCADVKAAVLKLGELRAVMLEERGTKPSADYEPTEAFLLAAQERIAMGLALLRTDAAAARLPEAEPYRDELRKTYSACRVAQRELPKTLEIAEIFGRMCDDLGKFSATQDEGARARVIDHMKHLERMLSTQIQTLKDEPYPLGHNDGEISLARFLSKAVLVHDDLGSLHEVTSSYLDNYGPLCIRLVGRLAFFAEAAEKAFGMPPLEKPADKPVDEIAAAR